MTRRGLIMLITAAILLLLIGMVTIRTRTNQTSPVLLSPTPSPISRPVTPILSPSQYSTPSIAGQSATPSTKKVSSVLIYLVALNDNGKTGTKIGCGDSLIGVTRSITPTTMPLTTALNELVYLHQQYLGESGLYNSLYQSHLTVQKASVDSSGTATIQLSGTVQLGGVCDDPRFKAQLEQTVKQFPTVKQAAIFINGRPLDAVVSEK